MDRERPEGERPVPAIEYATPMSHPERNDNARIGLACGISQWVLPLCVVGGMPGLVGLMVWGAAGFGAIWFGIRGLGWAKARQGRDRAMAWWAVALGASGFVVPTGLAMLLLTGISATYERANRVKCASNLRQVGQAMLVYANDHGGAFPDNLGRLIEFDFVIPEAFVCPSSADEKARGATTQTVVADLARPGRSSYVYLGAGMTTGTARKAVVAYEPASNHEGEGLNVLFASGAVEWFGGREGRRIEQELKAGVNPPKGVGE